MKRTLFSLRVGCRGTSNSSDKGVRIWLFSTRAWSGAESQHDRNLKGVGSRPEEVLLIAHTNSSEGGKRAEEVLIIGSTVPREAGGIKSQCVRFSFRA